MAKLHSKLSYRIIDQLITILSFVLSYLLADSLAGYTFFLFGLEITIGSLHSFPEFILIIFIIPFIWWVALNQASIYDPTVIRNAGLLLWSLIKAHIGGGIVLFGLFYLAKLYFPSRPQMVFLLAINILLLYIEKRSIVYAWKRKKEEKSLQRILLIGYDSEIRRFARHIESYPELGYKIVGYLVERIEEVEESIESLNILGTIDQIEKVIKENPIEEVIVFSPRKVWEIMDTVAPVCEDMGIQLTMVPQWPSLRISRVSFRRLLGTPLVSFVITPRGEWGLLIKTVTDLMLALIAFILFSPLFILITILIKWDSKGPVFFIQKRVGLNGRKFSLIKFRSMVQDAEKIQGELQVFNEMSGPVFKMTNDPRITRVGHWLRRTSLDELPQLLNVLKGDLSLVGPRPPLPSEVALYERWQRRRLSVKPGITCIWQISGRNDINFDEWIKLDLNYIDHWSLTLDWKILIRTIPAVLSGRGAK